MVVLPAQPGAELGMLTPPILLCRGSFWRCDTPCPSVRLSGPALAAPPTSKGGRGCWRRNTCQARTTPSRGKGGCDWCGAVARAGAGRCGRDRGGHGWGGPRAGTRMVAVVGRSSRVSFFLWPPAPVDGLPRRPRPTMGAREVFEPLAPHRRRLARRGVTAAAVVGPGLAGLAAVAVTGRLRALRHP